LAGIPTYEPSFVPIGWHTEPDLVIECLETCQCPAGPKYGPIVSQEYFEEKMRRTYL